MVEFIKKNYKITILITVVVALIIFSIIFLVSKINSDGMSNKDILDISYRTYTKDWTNFTKNGLTSGNKKDIIQDIDISIKKTDKGKIFYSVYTDSWSDQIYDYTHIGKNIKGIRIGLSDTLFRKYEVCYRTYNKTDKWLNWTCNFGTSGNIKEGISAIEIKIIPKNTVKFDYLKDLNKNNYNSSKGFDKE